MIIIPDIHGRTFWKDALKENDDKVIFLGDYLDPYPNENITLQDTIKNFKEIIEEKKKDPERITLLLGNHDYMYISLEHNKIACRHDYINEPEIMKLFYYNRDLFKLGEIIDMNGQLYSFSHAYIHPLWIDRYYKDKTIPEVIEIVNNQYKEKSEELNQNLLVFSYYRGSIENFGSMIWSDIREIDDNLDKKEVYQIFGHTQLKDNPVITDFFADLDCRKAFKLINNKIEEL